MLITRLFREWVGRTRKPGYDINGMFMNCEHIYELCVMSRYVCHAALTYLFIFFQNKLSLIIKRRSTINREIVTINSFIYAI